MLKVDKYIPKESKELFNVYSKLFNNFYSFCRKKMTPMVFIIKKSVKSFNEKHEKVIKVVISEKNIKVKPMDFVTKDEISSLLNNFLSTLHKNIIGVAGEQAGEGLFRHSIKNFYAKNKKLVDKWEEQFPEWLVVQLNNLRFEENIEKFFE